MDWLKKFWGKHGERLVFLSIAVIMAVAFWFMPDMRESGKVILIGAAMLCYNKARSGVNTPTASIAVKKAKKVNPEAGFINLKILLFFVVAGMLVLTACSGFKDKTLAEKSFQSLSSVKVVVVGVAEMADGLCSQGILDQDQCDEIAKAYESTLMAYDSAADLLAAAIMLDDPEMWNSYQRSFSSFLTVFGELQKIALRHDIYERVE